MKKLAPIVLIVLLACNGGRESEDALDIDDLLGQTGVEVDSLTPDSDTIVSDGTPLGDLINAMSPSYDTMAQIKSHPMDRFSFSTSRKIQFRGNEEVPYGSSAMVTPTANFFYYSFADSNKTLNAFYNYLDVMASDGEGGPVKLNEDVKSIKMPPMFMLVYDTIIVSTQYMCEHAENDWKSFQDSVLNTYGKNYKYQIDVACGGPLKWK